MGVISGHLEPALIEAAGPAGFDFYIVDVEHSSSSDRELEESVRAGDAAGIPVLARLSLAEMHRVAHFLDAGGDGIVLAHVTGRADVDRLLAECFYPPKGSRGAGATRIARYGFEPTTEEWLRGQEDALFVGALIEETRGLAEAESIIAHPDVDAVFVGMRDLSLSLGIPGDLQHPQIRAALNSIESLAERHHKPVARMVRRITSSHEESSRISIVGIGTILRYAAEALK